MYFVFVLTALAVSTEAFGIALLLPLLHMIETAGLPQGPGVDAAADGAAGDAGNAGMNSGSAGVDAAAGGAAGAGSAAADAAGTESVGAETAEAATNASGLTEILQQLLNFLGIGDSVPGILAFIALVFVAKAGIRFAEGSYLGLLSSSLLREMKRRLFGLYSSMTFDYYSEHNTGHFINIISQQVSRLIGAFFAYKQFLSHTIVTVLYLGFAFVIAWRFALLATVAGGIILLLYNRLNTYLKGLSRRTSTENTELHSRLVQTLQAYPYIAATARFDRFSDRVMASVHRLTSYYLRQQIAGAFTGAIREPVTVILILGIVIFQITLFEARIAPILVSLLLIYRAVGHIFSVQSTWQRTMNLIGGVEMVEDEMREVAARQETGGSTVLDGFRGQIVLSDVTFRYSGRDKPALDGVSLTIDANSTVALFGPSGAGKSTLINLITLLHTPQQGTVHIDGVPHAEIDRRSWRRQIGYVPQQPVMFDDTVANNISLWAGEDAGPGGRGRDRDSGGKRSVAGQQRPGDGSSSGVDAVPGGRSERSGSGSPGGRDRSHATGDPALRQRIEDAAERAGALDFIRELPDGFDTKVGDRGIRLSGGQLQRIMIARELFKDPVLLILDEATSALDSISELAIRRSMERLQGTVTMVLIAHRLSTIRHADTIFLLDEGRLVGSGSFDELADNPAFRRIAGEQV